MAAAAVLLLLPGCATRPTLPGSGSPPLELTETPFFPQDAYQCGPAALATVLNSAGVAVQPDALVEQVYLPARQGSLQVELLAATRRAGRIPYRIDPELGALGAELAAGRPVLVLQNLGLGFLPVWHYAVVVGLDPIADEFILRSGTERRRHERAHAFLRSWQLADHWGFVALRPGQLPATVERTRYLEAVASAESHLPPQARREAYQAALARWPRDPVARFGLAYALHAAGDLANAEAAYRALIAERPRHVIALNNLAEVLATRGCHAQARQAASHALVMARDDHPGLVGAVSETLAGIPPGADGPGCPSQSR
jgi:tetratricopeptide (TPR) repeat protein